MLTHQDEDQNEDSWNAAAAASTCLGLCAVCETDDVVPFVMEFVSQHHDSSDWHYKDAAFMAFGSIMVRLPVLSCAFVALPASGNFYRGLMRAHVLVHRSFFSLRLCLYFLSGSLSLYVYVFVSCSLSLSRGVFRRLGP